MNLAACARVLTETDLRRIHDAMLRLVSEVGMKVENEAILSRLEERGGVVDRNASLVRFAPAFIEAFLADSTRFDWDNVRPVVSASAGIYLGWYLDPETDRHVEHTEERIATYAKVAHYLDHIDGAHMLGCPVKGVPNAIHPLYQRYLCWKHRLGVGGSIWDLRLCPYLLEMCDAMGDATGKPGADYFSGAVYLSGMLKFPRIEAEQYVYFAERGLPVAIGHMTSAGGSAPVTLAGAVAVHLAEAILINVIQRSFYDRQTLDLSSSIAPLDMRTMIYPYGRPERQLCNLMMADMARHYGASFSGHGGHTDAKRPSPEAGAQRALTTLPTLMSCGRASVGAGLLSIDEVQSPIQMILDNEFVGALRRLVAGCEISDETLAVDLVKEVGPGGVFMGTDHTAAHFRGELWEPSLWSREMFQPWLSGGGATDVDKAMAVYRDLVNRPAPPPGLSDETDRALLRIMDDATRKLG